MKRKRGKPSVTKPTFTSYRCLFWDGQNDEDKWPWPPCSWGDPPPALWGSSLWPWGWHRLVVSPSAPKRGETDVAGPILLFFLKVKWFKPNDWTLLLYHKGYIDGVSVWFHAFGGLHIGNLISPSRVFLYFDTAVHVSCKTGPFNDLIIECGLSLVS